MNLILNFLDRVRPVKQGPSRQYRAEVLRFLLGDWSERASGGREFRLDENEAEGLVTLHQDVVMEHERGRFLPAFAADAIGRMYDTRLVYNGGLSRKLAS